MLLLLSQVRCHPHVSLSWHLSWLLFLQVQSGFMWCQWYFFTISVSLLKLSFRSTVYWAIDTHPGDVAIGQVGPERNETQQQKRTVLKYIPSLTELLISLNLLRSYSQMDIYTSFPLTSPKWCDKGRKPWLLVARIGVWEETSLLKEEML